MLYRLLPSVTVLVFTFGHSMVTSALAQRPDALPSGTSDTAFVLARAGVVPENLVYDPARDRFLAADLEHDGLIEMRGDGSIRPFATAAGIDGRVLGLKMDAWRNILWGVAFTRLPVPAGDTTAVPARSIIFALSLPEGRLLRRIASPKDGASHLFNDLVVARDGTVYFTDSEAGAVWALHGSKLKLLHRGPPERFAYPNGIAFLPGEAGLLVAYWQGLITIALPSGEVAHVRAANDSLVGRIDGLYPACGGYVGIQNMATPSKIIAFRLEGRAAAGIREIERGRADFRGPTTGAVVKDTLFYVANAQIGPFDPRNEGGSLAPVLILEMPLGCRAGAASPSSSDEH
jgi:sugar lactone lactonase YvrE